MHCSHPLSDAIDRPAGESVAISIANDGPDTIAMFLFFNSSYAIELKNLHDLFSIPFDAIHIIVLFLM